MALPSPNKAVQILINTIKIVSAHMIKERIREILFKRLNYSDIQRVHWKHHAYSQTWTVVNGRETNLDHLLLYAFTFVFAMKI